MEKAVGVVPFSVVPLPLFRAFNHIQGIKKQAIKRNTKLENEMCLQHLVESPKGVCCYYYYFFKLRTPPNLVWTALKSAVHTVSWSRIPQGIHMGPARECKWRSIRIQEETRPERLDSRMPEHKLL